MLVLEDFSNLEELDTLDRDSEGKTVTLQDLAPSLKRKCFF